MKKKTRRTFIRTINAGIAALFLLVWNKLTLNHLRISGQTVSELPFNKNREVSFFDDHIVIQQNDEIRVLSSHCSHLGCRINKIENGRLICPCHGSEYDLDGKPVKGPAYKNLEQVRAELSDDGSFIKING